MQTAPDGKERFISCYNMHICDISVPNYVSQTLKFIRSATNRSLINKLLWYKKNENTLICAIYTWICYGNSTSYLFYFLLNLTLKLTACCSVGWLYEVIILVKHIYFSITFLLLVSGQSYWMLSQVRSGILHICRVQLNLPEWHKIYKHVPYSYLRWYWSLWDIFFTKYGPIKQFPNFCQPVALTRFVYVYATILAGKETLLQRCHGVKGIMAHCVKENA